MDAPWFAIFLMIAFYFLVAAEFFLPTAGMAGVGAVATLIAAIAIAWQHSMGWAVGVVAIAVVSTPPLLAGLVQVYPRTPLGKRILNRRPSDPLAEAPVVKTRTGRDIDTLVGKTGVAKTDLLPSGWVVIDGEKIDALSVGMPIDQGTPIVVVKGDPRVVQVRPLAESEQAQPDSPTATTPTALEQSLEELE